MRRLKTDGSGANAGVERQNVPDAQLSSGTNLFHVPASTRRTLQVRCAIAQRIDLTHFLAPLDQLVIACAVPRGRPLDRHPVPGLRQFISRWIADFEAVKRDRLLHMARQNALG